MEHSKQLQQWKTNDTRDSDLLAQHYAGDKSALPKLFAIYYKVLMITNLVFWRNKQDAEDATQNQMEQMINCFNAGKYNNNKSFGAWVHTCARYSNLNAKRNKVMQEVDIDEMINNIAEEAQFETITEEMLSVLKIVLQKLKPEEQKLIMLRAINQFSYIMVGDKMHITANSASQRYTILLSKLNEELKKNGIEEIIF